MSSVIQMFNINDYSLNTSMFDHSLHGSVVEEFENTFANYVGAKYACSISSATNAIFLCFLNKNQKVSVPSMIPPVVLNAILNGNNEINFVDNVDWVGDSYVLHRFKDYKIVDSAQKVEKDQFVKEANDEDLMIFSFYPTKPVGSVDGGMIVSNDYNKIKWLKQAVMNGMSYSKNNWERQIKFPGWKMYMSTIQAYIALQNFQKLEDKKEKLARIRKIYNEELGYNNTSEHLYRIRVKNRENFLKNMKKNDIICGIHYKSMHKHDVYGSNSLTLPKTEKEEKLTVSLPFHEKLTDLEIEKVLKNAK